MLFFKWISKNIEYLHDKSAVRFRKIFINLSTKIDVRKIHHYYSGNQSDASCRDAIQFIFLSSNNTCLVVKLEKVEPGKYEVNKKGTKMKGKAVTLNSFKYFVQVHKLYTLNSFVFAVDVFKKIVDNDLQITKKNVYVVYGSRLQNVKLNESFNYDTPQEAKTKSVEELRKEKELAEEKKQNDASKNLKKFKSICF